jgi:N-acetylneuraminate lyase
MTCNSQFDFIPATFTPFADDGSIDLAAIERYANYLAREGFRSVFVNGSTGESLSVTTDERERLVEAWIRHAQGRLRVLVHVGDTCITRAKRLAQHAELHTADGIACMAPCFFMPRNVDELLDFVEPVAASAPNTNFYYYHLPSMTGMRLDAEELIAKADERIPTFAGVKFSHGDFLEFQRCESRWRAKYQLFFGMDELLLPALACHARAGVGTIYNLAPESFAAIADCYFQGDCDLALKISHQVNRFIETLIQVGAIAGGKVLLAQLGIGNGMVRLPLKTLTEVERTVVFDAAKKLPLDTDKWKPNHALGNIHIPLGGDLAKRVNAAS